MRVHRAIGPIALLALVASCAGASSSPTEVVIDGIEAIPPSTEVEELSVQDPPRCFKRMVSMYPCHGAPIEPPPGPEQVETCDGCRTAADCTAMRGGECVEQRGNTCMPSARVCRYPNDECNRSCPGGGVPDSRCFNDGKGRATCQREASPPP
ncbi:hypothetical protein [Polyangium aurulentum]|uniref:hypothetical protein n=1 Tax=Polyangium aurulentum TaxID=2567896 RepID=UPI0010AE989E|nr:hypothetical protein [Polyangium aurulentum]UQA55167.1 hypothetical protein E8A73_027910 [Polyangium aurulentum]